MKQIKASEHTDDLRPEYDFDFSKAERGRYAKHPQAQYFTAGKIEKHLIADYAKRKGMTLEEAERWLASVLSY